MAVLLALSLALGDLLLLCGSGTTSWENGPWRRSSGLKYTQVWIEGVCG